MNKTKNKYHLEHVTTYIYKNKKHFQLCKLKKPLYSKFKFSYSIDTPKDLERSLYIYKKFSNITNANNKKIFSLTKQWYEGENKKN